MASVKGRLFRLLAGAVLTRTRVVAAASVGGFRRLVLRGDVPPFGAGAKVQVLLPSDETRTYTPIPDPEGLVLLGWEHAGGPGARWIAGAAVGDEVPYLGPQRSLTLPPGPVLLVGDETSVAVAAAYHAERPGQVHAIFQARDADGLRAAAAAVGLRAIDVVAPADTAATLHAARGRLGVPGLTVGVTGASTLVAPVRAALRAAGAGDVRVKAYWIPGRVGLD